jgi:very-short-patch-repair endonuclease
MKHHRFGTTMDDISQQSRVEFPLSVRAVYAPFVNFAMQQNAIPLLRSLVVMNSSDKEATHVVVRVWSDPLLTVEKTLRVDKVGPGASYPFSDLVLTFLREPLRKQSEREEGHLWIEVAADGLPPSRQPLPLSVLAYNEWFGVSSFPEIIAAHVLPNDPAIEHILAEASKLLLEKTNDGSLSGYQTGDPKRAWTQAAAIYYAAARQKISYINPPASFEENGQKIRTPQHLLDRKLGTCMDTTTLLAACFEQAGLRPVVVLMEEHAFPGVWLVDKSFDDTVTGHASILLNRIGLGEFLVVESTGIVKTPPLGFQIALEQAQAHLQSEARFHFAVDIKTARKVGIRPLSLTEEIGGSAEEDLSPGGDAVPLGEDLAVPETVAEAGASKPARQPRDQESAADRLARWKTSLLDLSLRNRLLNFKDTKKAIPLLCPDIARLEDALAADQAFRVRPKPDAWGATDPRDATMHQEQIAGDPLADYLREEMSQRRLHTAVTARELAVRLTMIERSARLGLEEGGANTLFLALGFLVWTEPATSDIERRAPILLIPMSIERKSVHDGFRIQRIDEESRINITLLQKLRMDFDITVDGLDPLPEDDSGLDVPRILRIIRDAIKREPRWKVEEDASLTILTFSRFLMWLDLEANAEELKKNAVVRHLIESSNELFDPSASYPDLETLDDRYPPSETFCPLHADSSQLRAVYAASEGRTFVLQGPPGTGKSQTITNLIAHCLTVGKRVLFVAQKRAALDVVHKRLTDVGLGPFCLVLHSNKTTRESFRAQLRDAISVAGTGTSNRWEAETNRLAEQRKALNEYARDLHKPRAFGKSAYWVISSLIGHRDEPKVTLDLGDPDGWTTEEFERKRAAVREVAIAARVSGDPVGHPLAAVRLAAWIYGIEDDAAKAIRAAEEAHQNLIATASSVIPDLGLGLEETSLSDLKLSGELTALLETAPSVTQVILAEPDWQRIRAELTEWIELGCACAARRSTLLETNTDGLLALNLPALIEKLRARKEAWFWKRWRMGSFVRKAVRAVRKDGKKPTDLSDLEEELGQALTVVEENAKLETQGEVLSRLFGPSWQGLESQWDELQRIVAWTDKFRALLERVPGVDLDAKLKTRGTWMRLATEGRALFVTGARAAQQARAFRDALQGVETQRAHLGTLLHLDAQLAWGGDTETRMLERAGTTLKNLAANLHHLRDWSHYQASRAVVVEHNLVELAGALERGEIGVHQLESVFEHSFADWWARTVLKSVPSLAFFIGERHHLKILEFQQHDAKVADLTKKETFARIASRMPRTAAGGLRTPASSEAGLLQRFAQGGRKTIRRIFKECPNAIAKYKSCVLMSPLSVAQFIGADFPKFDLVVFDEASQMPTYDAIGAIARGNQLIVVGDSRQLPPTSFFERQKSDEEYSEDDLPEELESILEEAEAAGIKPLRLDWHYRSRHESLIAFSNRQYYENRLHTFPAAFSEHPRLGVQWCEVPDGVYDYGKSKTNLKEAEAMVAEIVRRLRDPKKQNSSLGVVTFSQAQQSLVEDLLDAARSEYPEIEPYFTTVSEPVFVKNLETVQGDERDVILFSICYGPDAAGIIRMNFGPLNNKGGERRLNVAITRARKQMLVFSRLRPEQIDLSRTQATGVHHLRTFLDYAKRGPVALVEEVSRATGEVESFFEQSVLDELMKRGWRVDAQVGCSGYRIDLAVRDPEAPGRYLLGVECDGANYHSAKSARDRDRLRQAVLEGLGWRLHRIWSTDWWLQRPNEIAKIEDALILAKQKSGAADDVYLGPPANLPPAYITADNPDNQDRSQRFSREAATVEREPVVTLPVVVKLPEQSIYQRYGSGTKTFSGELHGPANARNVRDLVSVIVKTEAPLLFESLCSEVASAWGLQRAGSRIREVVREAVRQNGLPVRRVGKREFVWTKELSEKPYEGFRVPGERGPTARTAQEICPEEIANAAAQVLILHISMALDDLVRETANVFGITRLGNKVRSSLDEGINFLKKNGGCRVDGKSLVAP